MDMPEWASRIGRVPTPSVPDPAGVHGAWMPGCMGAWVLYTTTTCWQAARYAGVGLGSWVRGCEPVCLWALGGHIHASAPFLSSNQAAIDPGICKLPLLRQPGETGNSLQRMLECLNA